jgi:hypothetical protein
MRVVVSEIPRDARPCALCDQPIAAGARRALVILADGLRWADQLCALRMNRGRTAMIAEAR